MSETTRNNVGVTGTPHTPKKRGNPNFQKGKKNTYYDNQPKGETDMSETTAPPADETKTPPSSGTSSDGFSDQVQPTSNAGDLPFDIFSDTLPGEEDLPLSGEVEEQA